MRVSTLPAIALLALTLAAHCASAQSALPWDYEGKRGALEWGKLDPAYSACTKGHEQSPVDIRGAHLNKALQPLEFHYVSGAVTLENTGRTIRAVPAPGGYMLAGGTRYNLVALVFHHPGEHAVHGKLTDMDVDLIHKSASGEVAIVDVQLAEDRGAPNAVMAALWPSLPERPGAAVKVAEPVNPAGFIPADPGYWTYMGSLTEPPCTEGVRWFVFEQPLSAGRDQLRKFAALYKVSSRPLQNIGKRKIEADE